jgi:hypothetical protein
MKNSVPIHFRLVPRAKLLRAQKAEMFELLAQHFNGVTAEQFARDLAEKNLVLLLEREDKLVGFSTLLAYSTLFEGSNTNVIYSGDTIVTPEAWGTTALPRAWVAGVDALRTTLPPGPCYWLLLTSGFRTYRFLSIFWREFFPRFDMPTPSNLGRLLDQLARKRFGKQFNSETGVVRFVNPQKLRADLKEIPAGREHDPHVSFFTSRNPGHAEGDELVCLAELCPENLTAAGRRMTRAHVTHSDHC